MKKLLAALSGLAFFSLFIACAGDREVNRPVNKADEEAFKSTQEYLNPNADYAQFPSFVNMGVGTDPITGNPVPTETKKFLEQSGWPDATQITQWKSSHSLEEAIAFYKSFKAQNHSHRYYNAGRQYGSKLILTQLQLLSTNRKADIAFFTEELVESQYSGMLLLEYCINKLQSLCLSNEKLIGLLSQIVTYYEPRHNAILKDMNTPPANYTAPQNETDEMKRIHQQVGQNVQSNEQAFLRLKSRVGG